MGIIIHMHIEAKLEETWYHYSAPCIFRDPVFFEMLSGIYNDPNIPKIGKCKGLPEGITVVTLHDYIQCGIDVEGHYTSWLNADEIQKLQDMLYDWAKKENKKFTDYDLETMYFHTFMNGNSISAHEGWDDVRLIYWFES